MLPPDKATLSTVTLAGLQLFEEPVIGSDPLAESDFLLEPGGQDYVGNNSYDAG